MSISIIPNRKIPACKFQDSENRDPTANIGFLDCPWPVPDDFWQKAPEVMCADTLQIWKESVAKQKS